MERKTGNKKWIIIVAVCLILILAVCICIYLFKKQDANNNSNNEELSSTGTEWGDIYLNYIQKSMTEDVEVPQNVKSQYFKNAESDIKVSFVEVKEQENPVMVLKYSVEPTEGNSGNIIKCNYIEDETKGKVNSSITIHEEVKFSETSNEKKEIKYLYNIEKDSYDWYIVTIHEEINNGKSYITKSYTPLYIFINAEKKQREINSKENAQIEQEINEVMKYQAENTYTVYEPDNKPKSKDVFIDINDMIEHSDFSFTLGMSMKEIRNFTNKFINMAYKTNKELITPEIEGKITTAKAEIKVDEERKAVEEEKKAKEQAQNDDDIKYGTYKGTGGHNGVYNGAKLVIKPNNTYTMYFADGTTISDKWTFYNLNDIFFDHLGGDGRIFEIEGNDTLVPTEIGGGKFTWESN